MTISSPLRLGAGWEKCVWIFCGAAFSMKVVDVVAASSADEEMSMGWKRWFGSVSALAAVALSLGGSSCGGGANHGTGATSSGSDGGSAAPCTMDSECAAMMPSTTPPNCAVGKCNVLEGVCSFSAKDEDGDGHPAANCTSNDSSATVQAGDDCNDNDPNLYPGHPEACSTTADGGVPAGTLCTQGTISCNANGSQSP
jgi:hypothetical protein